MDSLGNAEETYEVIKVHDLFIKPGEQTKAMAEDQFPEKRNFKPQPGIKSTRAPM